MQAKIMQENSNPGTGCYTFDPLLILVNDYYI
jgi:hypothetical protein